MYLPEFHYHRPTSIEAACRLLAECPDAAPLAGGTDLLVEMKQSGRRHSDLVSLSAIAQLHRIELKDDALVIGAAATHSMIMSSTYIRDTFPSIADAAASIGTDQIRNTATVGGNLCTGASCSDMAPMLMAYDAEVEITGIEAMRCMPLAEFFLAHRTTRLEKGELMTGIIVRRSGPRIAAWYEKYGLREAASISVASVAAVLSLEADTISDARIVIGAVAPTPKLSAGAATALLGQSLEALNSDSASLVEAGEAAAADALPIDDLRGSSQYRRTVIAVLTKRAVLNALKRERETRTAATPSHD